ncbi:hypothetical protein [Luteimonas vadosa]
MSAKPEPPVQMTDADARARRRGAVRTALVVGAIAVAIYIGFILLGVFGR